MPIKRCRDNKTGHTHKLNLIFVGRVQSSLHCAYIYWKCFFGEKLGVTTFNSIIWCIIVLTWAISLYCMSPSINQIEKLFTTIAYDRPYDIDMMNDEWYLNIACLYVKRTYFVRSECKVDSWIFYRYLCYICCNCSFHVPYSNMYDGGLFTTHVSIHNV